MWNWCNVFGSKLNKISARVDESVTRRVIGWSLSDMLSFTSSERLRLIFDDAILLCSQMLRDCDDHNKGKTKAAKTKCQSK